MSCVPYIKTAVNNRPVQRHRTLKMTTPSFPLYEYDFLSSPNTPCYFFVVPDSEGQDRTGAILDVYGSRPRVVSMHTHNVSPFVERGPKAWLSAPRLCRIATEEIVQHSSAPVFEKLQGLVKATLADARREAMESIRRIAGEGENTPSSTAATPFRRTTNLETDDFSFVVHRVQLARDGITELVFPVPDVVTPARGGKKTQLTGLLHNVPGRWKSYVVLHALVHSRGMDCSFRMHPPERLISMLDGATEVHTVDGLTLRRMLEKAVFKEERSGRAPPADLFSLHVPELLRRVDASYRRMWSSMRETRVEMHREIVNAAWHPRRFLRWCLSEEELAELNEDVFS